MAGMDGWEGWEESSRLEVNLSITLLFLPTIHVTRPDKNISIPCITVGILHYVVPNATLENQPAVIAKRTCNYS